MARRTCSRSMCARRWSTRSGCVCASCASLFGDARPCDAVAGPGLPGKHKKDLDQVPPRNDERKVAHERPSPAAVLALRREEAKAEELFAEGATAVAVAEEHGQHEDSENDPPHELDPAGRAGPR